MRALKGKENVVKSILKSPDLREIGGMRAIGETWGKACCKAPVLWEKGGCRSQNQVACC